MLLVAACEQRGLVANGMTTGLVALRADVGAKTVERILRVRNEPVPIEEWEDEVKGYVRSGFFAEMQRSFLEPVDRTSYHVLRNKPTPGELDGTLHP